MKLRPFELALVVIFGVMMVAALFMLRMYKGSSSEDEFTIGPVTVWGTLPAEGMRNMLDDISEKQKAFSSVVYQYVSPQSLASELVYAIADGSSPDLLLFSHEQLVELRERLESVPYDESPLRDFRNLYIEGGEIFAMPDGVVAYPVAVDPLMLYWNRGMLSQDGLLEPPATWESVVSTIVPTVTKRTPERAITRSAVALGEYANVRNAFAIISLLALQGGSEMVTISKGVYKVNMDSVVGPQDGGKKPLTAALTFYTNFNEPTNTLYSWGKTLPLDRDHFLAEQLALYFGFASEASELAKRNPNLDFDIAPVPQGDGATVKRTYGRFYGLAVPAASLNKKSAYLVRAELSSAVNSKKIADAYGLGPVHRSTLLAGSNDLYGRVVYQMAPLARGWFAPAGSKVEPWLQQLLREVSADRSQTNFIVTDNLYRLEQLY